MFAEPLALRLEPVRPNSEPFPQRHDIALLTLSALAPSSVETSRFEALRRAHAPVRRSPDGHASSWCSMAARAFAAQAHSSAGSLEVDPMPEPVETPSAALMRLRPTGTTSRRPSTWPPSSGSPDSIGDEPVTADEIAPGVGAHARSLYRLLRALSTVGIFRETDDKRFVGSPMSDLLRTDHPGSMWGWPAYIGRPHHRELWGRPATQRTHGTGCPAPPLGGRHLAVSRRQARGDRELQRGYGNSVAQCGASPHRGL
jgi:hypothetical protein